MHTDGAAAELELEPKLGALGLSANCTTHDSPKNESILRSQAGHPELRQNWDFCSAPQLPQNMVIDLKTR